MNSDRYSLFPVSESSLMLEFDKTVSIESVGYLAQQMRENVSSSSIINVVPSYRTILVQYLPFRISEPEIYKYIQSIILSFEQITLSSEDAKTLTIPVYYGKETALDLKRFEDKGIHLEQLIEAHTQPIYTVSAIGFAPGFAYLSDVPNSISIPRHASPRLNVPAGSVAIADSKTAVYPSDSPGGWNVIGRTPVRLFSDHAPFIPFEVGNNITFTSISRDEFIQLGGKL